MVSNGIYENLNIPRGADEKEKIYRENYRFNYSTKEAIGRMYNLSPKEGERYYIRLMLTQIPGAMSFKDLRTVNGEVQSSYKEVSRVMGLLKDDVEWMKAIRKAFSTSFVPLIHIFATIIAYSEPSDPKNIWKLEEARFLDAFRLRHMSFEQKLQHDNVVVSYATMEVRKFLETVNISSNLSVQKFGLQIPHEDLPQFRKV